MLLEILFYLFAGASLVTLGVHLILGTAVVLNRVRDSRDARFRRAGQVLRPRFRASVIVVAKDEERMLPECLSSLESQTVKGFEVVLLDDRSRDRTREIMDRFRRAHGPEVKVLSNRREPEGMGPKQHALDIAVEAATGDILLFTDADCALPPTWVEMLLPYFDDQRVGIVFGQISLAEPNSFLGRFQAFDQPLIHQWNSATAGLGMPGSCFGNNLAARRDAINEVGGFRGLGYTLTEDAALTAAIAKRDWKVRVSTRPGSMIRTQVQPTWRDFLNQHLRWNSGGFFHRDFSTRFGYRYITVFLIVSVLVLPVTPLWSALLIMPIASLLSVGLLALLAGLLYNRNKPRYFLRLVPYTIFFMLFYSYVTFLSILRVSPEWKGRRFEATSPQSASPESPADETYSP
jgi:cellulose synthase/poly-beta-1,6-N-acetylglucosamine synthase-like glycosyltransferase